MFVLSVAFMFAFSYVNKTLVYGLRKAKVRVNGPAVTRSTMASSRPQNLFEERTDSKGKQMEPLMVGRSNDYLSKRGKANGINSPEKALMVGLESGDGGSSSLFALKERWEELSDLTAELGIAIVACESQRVGTVSGDHLFGQGKIKDVAAEMVAQDCYCLLYDNELSPAQLRSLETALLAELPADRPLKILDRTLVLLDVMSKHSSSKVTSQQVDLAMLLYRIPRITQTWQRYANHFSGGITNSMTGGATRDPANVGYRFPSGKRIDLLDFREMRRKAAVLRTQLTDVRNSRKAQRESRKAKGLPSVCLLGYFGSGSTSVLGALSSSSTPTGPSPRAPARSSSLTSTFKLSDDDEMYDSDPSSSSSSPYGLFGFGNSLDCNHHFKTDCTVRKATHKHCPDFFVTETISLVHEFPQCLLEAFASNFDELRAADCLLHTVDVTDPHWQRQEIAVLSLLSSLGGGLENTNIITVWNKVDVFDSADMVDRVRVEAASRMKTVAVSAKTRVGVADLVRCISDTLVESGSRESKYEEVRGLLPHSDEGHSLLSKLRRSSSITSLQFVEQGIMFAGLIPNMFVSKFYSAAAATAATAF